MKTYRRKRPTGGSEERLAGKRNEFKARARLAGFDKILPFLRERVVFQIPSEVGYLEQLLEYLNQRLVEVRIVGPGETDLLIALDEAIVNAIKHGNRGDPAKSVQIIAEISAQGARFIIRDEGAGFEPSSLPDPCDPARLLAPSGRGLLLIKHIMDEVCHNETGNEIQMVKRAGQHASERSGKQGSSHRPEK